MGGEFWMPFLLGFELGVAALTIAMIVLPWRKR